LRSHTNIINQVKYSYNDIAYDAEGNNTQDAQGQTLVYDAWNRMTAIKDGPTVKIAYEYDGLFRRVQETVGTTVHSQYYSASWQVIEERVKVGTGADEVRVQNVWSAVYIDAMVLRDRDSDLDVNHTLDERVYPLVDANFHVSSIVGDTDAGTAGNQWGVRERYRYEPYGDRVVLDAGTFAPDTLAGSDATTTDDTEAGWNTSDVLFRHGHQGGAYDRVASEKMLFRFRTLDTQQMRWGQVDPLRYVDGMNAYEYVRSSPIIGLDPSGLVGLGRAGRGVTNQVRAFGYMLGFGPPGSASETWSAAKEGALDGGMAFTNGALSPIGRPFAEDEFYNPYDSSLVISEIGGHIARDAIITAASGPGNFRTWLKNPLKYEAGSNTVRTKVYKATLEHLAVPARGALRIQQNGGGIVGVLRSLYPRSGPYLTTALDGLTPGAGLLVIGFLHWMAANGGLVNMISPPRPGGGGGGPIHQP
jgi:RHS repeat-associated protein